DVISSIVYGIFHYGRAPEYALQRAATDPADLYLLLDVDVPFVADPVRAPAEHRQALFAQFRATLECFGARYEVVSGSWEERFEKAVAFIDATAF
ncbi:MAG TPA: AAA family ATPase, partial [Thermoanaerobaculia bacterium]|nr:AAA family ATPase [Thermoanaerobaculia bacterium]